MSYKITIPKPCSEDWNKMTTTQKGAFCKSCAKEVVDFTTTTKRELSRKIKQATDPSTALRTSICGRFKPEQLNTPLPRVSQSQFRHNAAMLGFTSLLALGTPLAAQQTTEPTQTESHYIVGRIAPQPVVEETYTLTGIVKDSNNLPLPGVSVSIKNTNSRTQTNMDGEFSLPINSSNIKNNDTIIFAYMGQKTQEIILKKYNSPLLVKLEEDSQVMGAVVVTRYRKNNIFRRVGNIFRKKHQ